MAEQRARPDLASAMYPAQRREAEAKAREAEQQRQIAAGRQLRARIYRTINERADAQLGERLRQERERPNNK